MAARLLVALVSGLLFGAGLAVSGMMNPAKVLNFLDLAGSWDPSLALVMGAALAVAAPAYRLASRREHPLLAARFDVPGRAAPDLRLVAGAALFGVGWGLVGLCPGPAVAVLVSALPQALVFVAALVVGMALYRLVPPPG